MVLIDTSRWIDHLSRKDPVVVSLLEHGQVLSHPFVIGELALANLEPRSRILQLLAELPQAATAEVAEVMSLINRLRLFGRGIGYVDAALLASARLTPGAILMTRDRRLQAVAVELNIG